MAMPGYLWDLYWSDILKTEIPGTYERPVKPPVLTVDRKRGLMYLLVTIYYSVQQVITEVAVLK